MLYKLKRCHTMLCLANVCIAESSTGSFVHTIERSVFPSTAPTFPVAHGCYERLNNDDFLGVGGSGAWTCFKKLGARSNRFRKRPFSIFAGRCKNTGRLTPVLRVSHMLVCPVSAKSDWRIIDYCTCLMMLHPRRSEIDAVRFI